MEPLSGLDHLLILQYFFFNLLLRLCVKPKKFLTKGAYRTTRGRRKVHAATWSFSQFSKCRSVRVLSSFRNVSYDLQCTMSPCVTTAVARLPVLDARRYHFTYLPNEKCYLILATVSPLNMVVTNRLPSSSANHRRCYAIRRAGPWDG